MACYSTVNTGQQYCTKDAIFGDPIGIILALDGAANEFAAADFLLETTYETGINARRLFPIMNLNGFTDNSTEVEFKEYPNKKRKLIKQGKYRFAFEYNVNENIKKELFDLQGFNQKFFLLYENNVIRGRTTDSGVTIKPIRIDTTTIHMEKQNPAGETPMTVVEIDLKSYKDLNQYDHAMEVAWEVDELDGLTEVDLSLAGVVPTITSLTIGVYATAYGETKPITGLAFADFSITGTGTLGVEGGFVDVGNGTYTFVTVGLANTDTVNLVAPASIADPDLFIISGGAVTVTGIS